ncbi:MULTISPECIES: LpqB family beta-propeller domain-containing protein [unclassified Micromonospora]|uniref:LpqB family beta-propeller domain-containing protein n=1 Tax=unclassified Micromonospora TaxID=2617518 RepID=UPI002FF3E70F
MVAPRGRTLAGALCAALLVVVGCGIPENTEVQVDGSGPAVEAGASSFRRDEPPARAAAGTDREMFVRNFLSAAAGEPERAYARVKQFIAPENKGRLQDKQGSEVAVNVVRLTEDPVITENANGLFSVRLPVQQIGVLRSNGVLAPPVATEREYRFTLRGAVSPGQQGTEEAGLFVTDPPNVLLLSDEALRQYYQTTAVYFWNSNQTRLVADQRYLPLTVPHERRVSEVVKWLIAGPSEWLRPGARPLPDRTALINNAIETDGRWEVTLELPGDDSRELGKIGIQLAWSLPELDGRLHLTTRNQSRVAIADLRQHRLAHPLYPIDDTPQRFAVYDGAIHALTFPEEASGVVPLVPAGNRNVVSAGLSRVEDKIFAALVVGAPGGRQRLAVGYGTDPVQGLTPGPRTFGAIGRPVWLRSLDPAQPYGLVVADGQLHRFDDRGRTIQVPLTAPGPVTAVAGSLDGHRLALVVGGRLYLAAVNLDGGLVSVGPAREVATSLRDLSAVDWAAENTLVVAGTADRSAVYQVSIDGALETALVADVGARVTHLTAYPTNPVVRLPSALIMYEANGVAYRYPSPDTIRRDQVLEVTPPPAGVRPGSPTAPFFLY